MSKKPIVADRKPCILELEPGTYYWCSCGRSQNQPFCDGAHWGSGFFPVEVPIQETRRIALCNCKTSQTSPTCDGSHKLLPLPEEPPPA